MLTHQLESLNLLLKALFLESCPARSVIPTPSVLTESSLRRPVLTVKQSFLPGVYFGKNMKV